MAYPSASPAAFRQLNLKLPVDAYDQFVRLAEVLTEGHKAQAFQQLLDTYGGKAIERAQQAKEAENAPLVLVRWNPGRLTPELGGYVTGLIRAGNMPEVACEMAGITKKQRVNWMKRGRADQSQEKQSIYADFVAGIAEAEAECEAEDIARLRKHGKQSWQAIAWRLERQYPDRYAQRKRIDGTVQHSMMPMVDWDRYTPAETRTLVELLRKGNPELDDPGVSRSARPVMELVPADVLEVIDGEAEDVTDQFGRQESQKPEP